MFTIKPIAIGIFCFLSSSLLIPGSALAIDVDRKIVIPVDVSNSIDSNEFLIQREGYANAFRNPIIQNAIENSINGIAFSYFYWGRNVGTPLNTGIGSPPSNEWAILKTAVDADNFANAIENSLRDAIVGSQTRTELAFNKARDLMEFPGLDATVANGSIIDISTDGIPTRPLQTDTAFRNALSSPKVDLISALTINDLGLTTVGDYFDTRPLVGGPGGQIYPIDNFSVFEDTITQKLAIEVGVPFEFSPGMSIFISLGIFGCHYWLKRNGFGSKT